jgi:ubiquinone biosynthesis protein COQ4
VSIKYIQALSAMPALAREPFDVSAIVKFVDALADWSVKNAVYRRTLAGRSADLVAYLRARTFEPVDLDGLAALPENTFGHQYARFFRANELSVTGQIDSYPDIVKVFERDWMTCRFIKTHDMVHLLLGLGVEPHGEMGVQVFNFRNFKEPYGGLAFLGFPFAVARYGRPLRMARDMAEGWRLGGQAENLFFVPLEDMYADDLEDVRAWVGIKPRVAGAPRAA